uniref:NADH-ubiquinone oxidoreductase chain 1 n=1 Tax=Bothus myriaster TaxID=366894 RepID=A0A3G0Z5U7_BOTMY|nr:NADH dehydrogenase subunit 1 [Bothus myriaster]AID59810.1 NADH dehydrogenase subunit 1 [Bothus myriaster]
MTSLHMLMTYLANPLALLVSVLLAVAFLTLVERKVLGYMQHRKGPNVLGPHGILQPVGDGVKLFIKEPIRPSASSQGLFIFTPLLGLGLALVLWTPLPLPYPLVDLNLNVLFVLALSSLAVYSILGAGWASNSKYALMGALRAVAQTISYEVSLGLIILSVVVFSGGFSMQIFTTAQQNTWLLLPALPLACMWFVSSLAETNRTPFDLTEGESELVSGFNVEYAAGPFALFFLAEYANILFMSAFTATLFLGTTYQPGEHSTNIAFIVIKLTAFAMVFLWIRASYPRFRYDQLMHLTWKSFLPLTLAFLTWHLAVPVSMAFLPPLP